MRKKVDWHEQCLIPELLYFQNGGSFTGSVGNIAEREFRYKLSPDKEAVEGADEAEAKSIIKVEVWYGPFCYEKSTLEDKSTFPMDEQGRSDAIDWLAAKYESMIPEQDC